MILAEGLIALMAGEFCSGLDWTSEELVWVFMPYLVMMRD